MGAVALFSDSLKAVEERTQLGSSFFFYDDVTVDFSFVKKPLLSIWLPWRRISLFNGPVVATSWPRLHGKRW